MAKPFIAVTEMKGSTEHGTVHVNIDAILYVREQAAIDGTGIATKDGTITVAEKPLEVMRRIDKALGMK